VARRLGEATTPAGLVGRVGGEEFGIAFSCEVATAIQACERVLDAFQNPIDSIAEGNIGVTVSLGVAIAQLQGRTAVGALYEQADRALYQAKAAGRNRMSLVELKAA
jgi:diguanylate cyclase (GGDEF)-like protein